ncbi:succinylglutamate desuccinylase, partial [Pseudomonas amygdali pv. mori str. 301020]
KRTDAFTFNLADAVENFSPLEKGYVLAEQRLRSDRRYE